MPEPFTPTHRLTVARPGQPVQVVELHLERAERGSPDGYAYTAGEWARDDSASWEHRDGQWLLDGVPVMDPHPDRPAASSVQVERVRG